MPRYKSSTLLIIPAVFLIGLAYTTPSRAAVAADPVAVLETRMALRDLWVEHAFWIRNYVLATHVGDTAQIKAAEAEVLANATALAGSVEPFYGQPAADSLLKLLAGHWGAVRDYDTATRSESKSGQDKATADLTGNAHAIAKFLSGANPHLPEDAVFGLLSSHAGHHVAQINEISSGKFEDEAATWHAMRKHMLVIADAIGEALAKQFPSRFQEES